MIFKKDKGKSKGLTTLKDKEDKKGKATKQRSDVGSVTVICDFGGSKAPFDFYIGMPEQDHHPVYFQNNWLSSSKGGNAPQEWLTSVKELHDISIRNGVDFKDLVMYVMSISASEKTEKISE